ncbi:GNAT family N-acetyltransferase [Cellulomonas humilata]|uniref:RimJ/RimL family protein N-acetyltransferase n=1 Tax=Cellulomonas humilata TaxID=144055 RepID=A0ABU0ECJ3_9CELL|nr:GNAT family protein [Cellulomonas humilata]MDQ0372562.1 RimJ/RimL family protein N-acetyltransferase [Cellulomonas humilata]
MDDLWPLAALRVRSGDLELRYMDDADIHALARLAADGVHAPDAMPFTVPWTRGTPTEVSRSVLTYQWGARASASPERWNLELAVVRDGEVLGTQSLTAHDFPVTRTAETGSWLGLRHHGQGIGTRMRLMILHLLFEGFDGLRATTSAFDDNASSNGVTRRIGYAQNGAEVLAREGKPATSRRYGLDRATWDGRPAELRPEVDLVGVAAVREQLGI